MDIRELRVGNFVFNRQRNIEEITELCTSYLERINDDYPESFSPIPLTEELLKINGEFICFQGDDKQYVINGISILVNGYDPEIIKIYNAIITSVHHLQNIIFDLTGEELEVKF